MYNKFIPILIVLFFGGSVTQQKLFLSTKIDDPVLAAVLFTSSLTAMFEYYRREIPTVMMSGVTHRSSQRSKLLKSRLVWWVSTQTERNSQTPLTSQVYPKTYRSDSDRQRHKGFR